VHRPARLTGLFQDGAIWLRGVGALCILMGPESAAAQSTAPSSITPPTLLPPPVAADAPPIAEVPTSLTPPAGTGGLTVRARAVEVTGAFPELALETRRIADTLVGRRVTLEEIYKAASAIEAAHIRRGYVLARATVPPQRIADGGTITIIVIDGFIEKIDLAALPARLRAPVRRRVDAIESRRHLTLRDIEQRLMIAGDLPGLALTSTLARGETAGGATLLLAGRYRPVSGSVTVDNSLASSLGGVAVTAQMSLNSVLGLGEQLYGFAVTGYDIPRAFRADAPVRVVGGGALVALGDGRFSLNPEITVSRTQPLPEPGVPRIRGTLRRLSLRGGYVLAKSRRGTLAADITIERIREANDAIDFDTAISLDEFTAVRAQLSYAAALHGGGVSVVARLSHGLDGRAASDTPVSRQGARANFTSAIVTARLLRSLSPHLALTVTARGQTPFGAALFRSEQATLEGADALSSYIGGITAIDGSATLRAEIKRTPVAMGGVRLSPYLFGAAGAGWISRPTAVEQGRYTLYNPGLGLRAAFAGERLAATLEYGHGFSTAQQFNGVDRVAAALTLSI
jgi:hemolysin activation/secretion protein